MDQELPHPQRKEKLTLKGYLLCGWPLVMVFFGGAIGGGLGGGAYGVNVLIYRSKYSPGVKIILNIAVGLAAFLLWYIIATILQSGKT